MTALWVGIAVLVAIGLLVVALNMAARRAGYAIPGRSAVRCTAGHLFLATWVIGGSLTTVRLGPLTRWGRCPVGRHWATMHPVKDVDLTAEERAALAGLSPR